MTFSKENRKFPGEAALWKKSPLMQKLPNKRLKTNLLEYNNNNIILDKNESLKIDMQTDNRKVEAVSKNSRRKRCKTVYDRTKKICENIQKNIF